MQNIKKYFMTLALLITAVTGAWATEFTSLKVGDVLHVGDAINTGTNYTVYGAYLDAGFQPATLVRANIGIDDITESETGAYYLIKGKNDFYFGVIKGDGYEGGHWPVTDTSDGISVTAITPGNYTELTFAVHEPEITEWSLTPDADKKVWTLAEMPASDVELQVEYYAESNLFLSKEALADKTNIAVKNGETTVEFGDDGKSTTTVMEGNTVTVTYNGTKKLLGMKVEKKAVEEPVTLATPLTVEAITPGTIRVNIDGTLSTGMKYSVNGGTKTLITKSTDITVAKDDKVQFYGNGTQTQAYGDETVVEIKGDGDGFKTKVYGNIMSLLDEEGFATKTELPNASYVFYGLFTGNTTLIDASELLLPATTMTYACYYGMFNGCTSLTTAPKLPATTLATYCYYGMFTGCTSLTSAYVKAAYTGEYDECTNMFIGCPATGAVLHTTPDSKASWENVMGSGKTWSNWSVADDWQE